MKTSKINQLLGIRKVEKNLEIAIADMAGVEIVGEVSTLRLAWRVGKPYSFVIQRIVDGAVKETSDPSKIETWQENGVFQNFLADHRIELASQVRYVAKQGAYALVPRDSALIYLRPDLKRQGKSAKEYAARFGQESKALPMVGALTDDQWGSDAKMELIESHLNTFAIAVFHHLAIVFYHFNLSLEMNHIITGKAKAEILDATDF